MRFEKNLWICKTECFTHAIYNNIIIDIIIEWFTGIIQASVHAGQCVRTVGCWLAVADPGAGTLTTVYLGLQCPALQGLQYTGNTQSR